MQMLAGSIVLLAMSVALVGTLVTASESMVGIGLGASAGLTALGLVLIFRDFGQRRRGGAHAKGAGGEAGSPDSARGV